MHVCIYICNLTYIHPHTHTYIGGSIYIMYKILVSMRSLNIFSGLVYIFKDIIVAVRISK